MNSIKRYSVKRYKALCLKCNKELNYKEGEKGDYCDACWEVITQDYEYDVNENLTK